LVADVGDRRADLAMTEDVAAVDRQLVRSAIRTQRLFNHAFERLTELEAMLLGLVDVLVRRGVVTEDELEPAARAIRAELARRGEGLEHAAGVRHDPPAAPSEPDVLVDCAARMPVCRAVCCKLAVALSKPEVEAGRLAWDAGRPYYLRKGPDGRCSHQVRETGACGVYDERPAPCRRYTCATDRRIWADFDGMVLNHEWLAANVPPDGPELIQVTPPG
jgi:Fe-S-cluster containining protein